MFSYTKMYSKNGFIFIRAPLLPLTYRTVYFRTQGPVCVYWFFQFVPPTVFSPGIVKIRRLYTYNIYIAYHKIIWNSPVTYFKPNLHILFVCTYIFIYVQCITYNVYTHNVIFYNIYFDGRVPPLMGIFTNNQSFNIKKIGYCICILAISFIIFSTSSYIFSIGLH